MGRWQWENGSFVDELYPVLPSSFPTKIFKEDRGDYILSLRQSQEDENSQPFLDFMAAQLKNHLRQRLRNTILDVKKVLISCFEKRRFLPDKLI